MRRQQILDHRFARFGLEQLEKAELEAGARRGQRMHGGPLGISNSRSMYVRPAGEGRHTARRIWSRRAEQTGLGERADPPGDHVRGRLEARAADLP